jgi:hypothetical protein
MLGVVLGLLAAQQQLLLSRQCQQYWYTQEGAVGWLVVALLQCA